MYIVLDVYGKTNTHLSKKLPILHKNVSKYKWNVKQTDFIPVLIMNVDKCFPYCTYIYYWHIFTLKFLLPRRLHVSWTGWIYISYNTMFQCYDCMYTGVVLMYSEKQFSMLTHSIRDSETSIDFVQGPPGSRRERVNTSLPFLSRPPKVEVRIRDPNVVRPSQML